MKRSVLKEINYHKEEIILGAAIGENCAIFSSDSECDFYTTTFTMTLDCEAAGQYAVIRAVNAIETKGAVAVAVSFSGSLFPEEYEEEQLKMLMRQAENTGKELQVQIVGASGSVSSAVKQPILTVTGIGRAQKNCYQLTSGAVAGQDVVVTKWIGLLGTAVIADRENEELKKRFSMQYIEETRQLDQYLSIRSEAAIAGKSDVGSVSLIAEGGIYGALWNMAEQSGVGLKIELKKIPIRQETVEICNYFDINPYEMLSEGSLLLTTDNGWDLVKLLASEGVEAVVIGKTTSDHDRLIVNEDEKRFLTPPQPDSIFGILHKHN